MRAVKSVSIDSERRVIITFLDGSTETLYPNCIWCDSEALRQLIKDLLEEKADAIVQTINNVKIGTFEDGADEALIRKLLVSIEPIQEGEGDPSPENVRPISGWAGLTVVSCGKNLFSEIPTKGKNIESDGSIVTIPSRSATVAGIPIKGGEQYTLSYENLSRNGVFFYDNKDKIISYLSWSNSPRTFIAPTNAVTARFSFGTIDDINSLQLEYSSRASTYEPYKGSIYSITLETEAGTVYGGNLDVTSGNLTVDRLYIASYNGEALPSTWISDRDVYAEGTTPTTGAQVVYKLDEPIEYQLTPQEITTLLGDNNIWADSGDILELEYVADTKLYIGESQSGTLGSGRQSISNTDLQPVSEKTVEDLTEAVKTETAEKETQEETEDERGE